MAKALYRRHRPQKLADVIGQEQVTEALANSLKKRRVSHAYLFVGPRGTGKTSVARILAHEINGFDYQLEDDYVDIIEIDGASNRGIDDIRELREKASIAPSQGKFKVYIIDEVHMLTREAFNALLKTLEEPPAHVVFIMATTEIQKVPATILSRAQMYNFRLAEPDTMRKFLRTVADDEGMKIADDALEIVVKRGGGSFRDSLSLLDQIATLSDGEITRELVVGAMGLPEEEQIDGILAAYNAGDLEQIVAALKQMLSSGVKASVVTEELVAKIVAEPQPETLGLLGRLIEVDAPFPEAKLLVALTKGLEAAPRRVASATRGAETREINSAHGNVASRPGVQPRPEAKQARAENSATAEPESTSVPAPESATEHEAKPEPAPIAEPAETETHVAPAEPASTPVATDFNYDDFATKIQDLNDAIYLQLKNVLYELRGDTLHLYPQKKITARILASEKNLQVLSSTASPIKVAIHEFGEQPSGAAQSGAAQKPKAAQKDATAAKISAIIGGEVIKDGGENPF